MTYLRIRNWKKWQSYRSDRGQPPWIKLHRVLLRNPKWVDLTSAERGDLVAIWLLAADRDGEVPASPRVLRKLCHMDEEPDLQRFIELRFLEPGDDMPQDNAATPQAGGNHAAPTPHIGVRATSRRGVDAASTRGRQAGRQSEEETEKEPPPSADPLVEKIATAFQPAGTLAFVTAFPSQLEGVHRLAAAARGQPNPEEWIDRYLATARRLQQDGKGVFRSQQWTASAMCSERMMVRVIDEMPRPRAPTRPQAKIIPLTDQERAEGQEAMRNLKEQLNSPAARAARMAGA